MTKAHAMDTDAIHFQQPTGSRPLSRREVLWNELDRLHAQLGIDPPTATYMLEDLEAEVALARRAAHQPAVEARAHLDSRPSIGTIAYCASAPISRAGVIYSCAVAAPCTVIVPRIPAAA